MFDLSKIGEWLTISTVPLCAVILASGVLLLGPARLHETIGLKPSIDNYRTWIGLVFLVSGSVIVVRAGDGIQGLVRRKRRFKRMQVRLHNLTLDEKMVLLQYVNQNSRTEYFLLSNGVVAELESEGILFRVTELGDMRDGFAYSMQNWAWDYLHKHPHLLKLHPTHERR